MKKKIVSILLAASISIGSICPVWASMEDCHELVMSYIYADQDAPQEAGDYLYHDDGIAHRLTETTGYCMGTHGSHGDRMRKGMVAYTPESYGYCMEVYKAEVTENGYQLGEFIGLYEIKDTGYGKSTGQGKSTVRADKKSRGTIESGLSCDMRFDTYSECKKWMKETQGMIFIRIIPAKG